MARGPVSGLIALLIGLCYACLCIQSISCSTLKLTDTFHYVNLLNFCFCPNFYSQVVRLPLFLRLCKEVFIIFAVSSGFWKRAHLVAGDFTSLQGLNLWYGDGSTVLYLLGCWIDYYHFQLEWTTLSAEKNLNFCFFFIFCLLLKTAFFL